MLVLSRKAGERIRVDGPCELVVVRIGGDKVRIGVEAERSVKILRQELAEIVDDRLETAAARGDVACDARSVVPAGGETTFTN